MLDETMVGSPPMGSEEVVLPSGGKFYGDAVPDGKVMIRPWTTEEEKLLLTARRNREDVVDRVLDACLLTRTLPLKDYLVGDKACMLLALRCITLFPEYEFPAQCSQCGKTAKHVVDLKRDLVTKRLIEEDKETFKIKLPMCGKEVELRRLRGSDEITIRREIKKRSSIDTSDGPDRGDPTYLHSLALAIVSIDGVVAEGDTARRLLEKPPLNGRDSLFLQKAINDNECGVDLAFTITCPQCNFEWSVEVPMTDEFFRPRTYPGG